MGAPAGAEDPCDFAHGVYEDASHCAKSETSCTEGCQGSWCKAREKLQARIVEEPSESSAPTTGFCCFDSDSKSDVCGTCFPHSISFSEGCMGAEDCSECGGTWCGADCVVSEDGDCNKELGVYESDSFCAKSTDQCTDTCRGSWCISKESQVSQVSEEETEEENRKKEDDEHEDEEEHVDEDEDDEEDYKTSTKAPPTLRTTFARNPLYKPFAK